MTEHPCRNADEQGCPRRTRVQGDACWHCEPTPAPVGRTPEGQRLQLHDWPLTLPGPFHARCGPGAIVWSDLAASLDPAPRTA